MSGIDVYPGDDYPPYQDTPLIQYRPPSTSNREDPHPGGWLLYYPAVGRRDWGPVEPLHARNQTEAMAEAEEYLQERYRRHPEARPKEN